jgi:hypothetical protein
MTLAPLDDPAYQPVHPPVDGQIPPVVAKWGPRSQMRWFHRFNDDLNPQKHAVWDQFHCMSEHHRGFCCTSCLDDYRLGYDGPPEDNDGNPLCCCYALKEQDGG